jgi:hypothetical protein
MVERAVDAHPPDGFERASSTDHDTPPAVLDHSAKPEERQVALAADEASLA